jgi:hypothetical protein
MYQLLTAGFGWGASGVGWTGAFISALWMLLALALGKTRTGGQEAPALESAGT